MKQIYKAKEEIFHFFAPKCNVHRLILSASPRFLWLSAQCEDSGIQNQFLNRSSSVQSLKRMLRKKEYMCDCWGPFLAERYFRAGVSNRMCSWNRLKIELLRVDYQRGGTKQRCELHAACKLNPSNLLTVGLMGENTHYHRPSPWTCLMQFKYKTVNISPSGSFGCHRCFQQLRALFILSNPCVGVSVCAPLSILPH